MLLSNDELREKLGTKQDAKIIEWLRARRIRWDYDSKRRPITTLAAIERHLFKEQPEEVSF